MKVIGRQSEINLLTEVLHSPEAELIALYGRRRVGKTYLIRNVYEHQMVFELTGLNKGNLAQQLDNFRETMTQMFPSPVEMAHPRSWIQAFRMLIHLLESKPIDGKQVLFLDEFPWFDTPKSNFLAAFDHFWNSWASKQAHIVVVICGSAASWMIQNVVRNKGGLHNRITRRMRLMPFNLHETELFLQNKYINIDRYQILQLYMVTGGIPHYLKNIRSGESATQIIDRLCFTNDGFLIDEFKNLYEALFEQADKHIAIIKILANKPSGMTRTELMAACQLSTGGSLTKLLDELRESGFIAEYIPFQKTSKDMIYKLCDEYTLFYLKFIDGSKSTGAGTWMSKSASASWKSWSGLAFEQICMKHIPQIKKALGISGVYTEQSVWRYMPKKDEKGAQIDLLIDRQDNCINLCELKFSTTPFVIDKFYAAALKDKQNVFLEKTGCKKTIFITMLTTFGVKMNEHYLNTIQNQQMMPILFDPL
ncbi:MAG: hypothetical protein RL329_124 [Bacteroidota bacterium]